MFPGKKKQVFIKVWVLCIYYMALCMGLGKKPEYNLVMKKKKRKIIDKNEELKQLFRTMRGRWEPLGQATHGSHHPKRSLCHTHTTCLTARLLSVLAEPCSKLLLVLAGWVFATSLKFVRKTLYCF